MARAPTDRVAAGALPAAVVAVSALLMNAAQANTNACGGAAATGTPTFRESVATFAAYRAASRQETLAAGGPMAGDAEFLRTTLIPFGRENARKLAQDAFNPETIVGANLPFMMALDEPGRDVVVLVHGLLSTPAMMLEWGRFFSDAGFNVIGLRLAGHGTQAKDLAPVQLDQWREDLRCGVQLAHGIGKRVYLFGYSLGGALAIDAALDPARRHAIDGAIAMAPAIQTSSRMKGVCGLAPNFSVPFDVEKVMRPFMYDRFVAGALCELSTLQQEIAARTGPALATAEKSKEFVALERTLFESERSIQQLQVALEAAKVEAEAESRRQARRLADAKNDRQREKSTQKYLQARAARQARITRLRGELDDQRTALSGGRKGLGASRTKVLQQSGLEGWASDPVPLLLVRSEYDGVVNADALRSFAALFAHASFVNYHDEHVTHGDLPILRKGSLSDQLTDLVGMEYFLQKQRQLRDNRDDAFYRRKEALQAAILAFISGNPE